MSQPIKKLEKKLVKKEKKQVQQVKAAVKSVAKQSLLHNPAGKIKGKGGYFSDFLGGLAKAAPAAISGFVKGGPSGALAGGLGSLLSGFGDYRSRAAKNSYTPMAMGDAAGGGPGSFVGGSAPRMRHREYICNIYSSIAFATTTYPIQIAIGGEGSLFPWLSTMADSFQQYRLHGMELYFESTCSNVSATTNTALGTVMMSTQYEVTLQPQSSSQEILNSEYTTSEKPTENFYHPIECDPKQNAIAVLYTRIASAPQTSFTDLGNFQVSTEGMQANGVQIGKLWCTYDVELIKPTLPQEVNAYYRNFQLQNPTGQISSTGCYISQSGGDVVVQNSTFPGNSLPIFERVTSVANPTYYVQSITFPSQQPGQYLISMELGSLDAVTQYAGHGVFNVIVEGGLTLGQAPYNTYWFAGNAPVSPATYYANQWGFSVNNATISSAVAVVGVNAWAVVNVTSAGGVVVFDFPATITGSGYTTNFWQCMYRIIGIPNFNLSTASDHGSESVMLQTMMNRLSVMESKMERLRQLEEQCDRKTEEEVPTPTPSLCSSPHVASLQDVAPGWFGRGSVKLPPLPPRATTTPSGLKT